MKPEEVKEESLQNTQLYKDFKKALNINHDMRPGDNPFIVACINITKQYTLSLLPSDEEMEREKGKYYLRENIYDLEQGFDDAIEFMKERINLK